MGLVSKFAGKAFIKETERHVLNPLGVKTTALFGATSIAAVGAWGYGAGKVTHNTDQIKANAEYVGNMSSMDYDGVPNVDRKTGKRDFGATGDLVFGLNKSRKG